MFPRPRHPEPIPHGGAGPGAAVRALSHPRRAAACIAVASTLALFSVGAVGGPDEGTLPLTDQPLHPGEQRAEMAEEAVSGGPPPDGIPSIDEPVFEAPEEAEEWLHGGDTVFGIVRDGEARAYPQRILVWHEIVNDTVGDERLAVTYCPLTGTALGFHRGDTTFGVSGQLINSNLILFDRATESWFPQVSATGIQGQHEGKRLQEFPVIWTTFDQWRDRYPDTKVLTRDTGHARNYNRDPYGGYNPRSGYYASDRLLFPVLHEDDRLEPKEVVIGARTPGVEVAFHKDDLRGEGRLTFETDGGQRIVALYEPALDTAYVFKLEAGASALELDDLVHGPDGPGLPAGKEGRRLPAFDAMWFAWAAFHPDTALVTERR